LLDNNDFRTSKKILMVFYCSKEKEITMEECNEIDEFVMREMNHSEIEVIWGIYFDDTLGEEVKATIIATGFESGNIADAKPKDTRVRVGLDGKPIISSGTIVVQPSSSQPVSSSTLFQMKPQVDTAVMEEDPELSVKNINDNEDYFERLNSKSAFSRNGGQQKNSSGFSNLSFGKYSLKDKNDFLNDNPD